MKTLTFILTFAFSFLVANEIQLLQYQDINVVHKYLDKEKQVTIQREINPKCLELGISHDTVFSGNMANRDVPKECKKTFVTTLGSIQPITAKGIKTAGELEVLEHIIKAKKNPEKYVLIDSRRNDWFENLTIPSAVNIPYSNIIYDSDFPEDFEKLLKTFNIKKDGDKLDFSNAKEAILFCNGIWCVQSVKAISILNVMGYPKEKLIWYRGGIQQWISVGLTTIRGDLKE